MALVSAVIHMFVFHLGTLYPAMLSVHCALALPAPAAAERARPLLAFWATQALARGLAGAAPGVVAGALASSPVLQLCALVWLLSPVTAGAERTMRNLLRPLLHDARTVPPILVSAYSYTSSMLRSPFVSRAMDVVWAACVAMAGLVAASLPMVMVGGTSAATSVGEACTRVTECMERARRVAEAAWAAGASVARHEAQPSMPASAPVPAPDIAPVPAPDIAPVPAPDTAVPADAATTPAHTAAATPARRSRAARST